MLPVIKNYFNKKYFVFVVLFLLLLGQLIYGFALPACGKAGTGHNWLSLNDLISHNRSPLEGQDVSMVYKFLPFFSNYNLVADGGVYILLAKNFPQYYSQDNLFLSRPLYSFLVGVVAFLPHLFSDSYAVYFAAAIFLNFILALATVILFYNLAEKVISKRVAFLSCLLFIFSPFIHAEIIQPEPGVYGAFMVVLGLFMLYGYIKKPSFRKLIIFSLLAGILLLGKLFCALSVFVILLAIYFKRKKEGFLFFIIHLVPLFLWYLYVIFFLKLTFFDPSVGNFGSGVWLLDILSWPVHKTAAVFIDVLPKFISAAVYGFFLVPLVFALAGFKSFSMENKKIISLGFVLSFLVLLFVANLYFPYYAFLMFPLVYPLAILGMDRVADYLKRYNILYARIFYLAVIVFFLFVSGANIYDFYTYWRI
jgi:hypothetical protein